jgi:hypothetical protein
MYACSPQWTGDWITVDRLERYLPQLAEVIEPSPYGQQHMSLNHGLHFSGGISLGSWFELDQLLQDGIDLQNRPALKFLVNQDMQGLFKFAAERGYHELSDGYVSKCHLCLDIRKFLTSTGDYPEISPIKFYEQLK